MPLSASHSGIRGATDRRKSGREAAGGVQRGDDAEVPDEGGTADQRRDAGHDGRTARDDDAARHARVHRRLADEAAAHRHATRYVRERKGESVFFYDGLREEAKRDVLFCTLELSSERNRSLRL